MARNIISAKDLIWQLFKRDYFAAYKKSFIGFSWIVLAPMIGILSWIFLKQTGMLRPGDVAISYPAYVLIGSSMWGLFMGIFTSVAQTFEAGQVIIVQVNFPREALVLKQAAINVANFFISLIVNLAVLASFGITPSYWTALLPLIILPLFFLATAAGLIVSMFSVVAFDINKFVTSLVGLLLYTVPVIYSDKIENPVVRSVIKWNPLTYLVCSARDLVIYGRLYDTQGYLISSVLSAILFIVALRLFFVSEDKIIERML